MFPKPIFSYTKLTYLSNLFHFLLARWSKKQFCDILKHICLKPPTNQILHFCCCCCCFIYFGRYQLWKMEIIKWCKNKTLSERGGHRGQKWQINCKSNNNFLQIIKKCWLNTNSKKVFDVLWYFGVCIKYGINDHCAVEGVRRGGGALPVSKPLYDKNLCCRHSNFPLRSIIIIHSSKNKGFANLL